MDAAFHGFSREAFEWFAGLERDNSRAYFTATRERYETDVRGALTALLDDLREAFGGEVKVFRQQRDLRFSADKTPYKTRTYGVLEGSAGARLYADLSVRGLYAGSGYHRLARDQLERFRAAVDSDETGPELEAAVQAARTAGVDVDGERLRGTPRGYPAEHPRIELLRHTGLFAGGTLASGGGITRDDALGHVSGAWRGAAPLNAWLDAHIGPSTLTARR